MNYLIYLRNGSYSDPSTLVYNAGWPDGALMLPEATLEKELDQSAKLAFSIMPDHPVYDDIRLMHSTIDVFEDNCLIFRGRPVQIKTDNERKRTITCEDCLNWLADIPDRYSNKNATEYKWGTAEDAVSVTLTGTRDGIQYEFQEGDAFGTDAESGLYVHEFDSVFDVEVDGKTYRVPMEEYYEQEGSGWKRVGYLGNVSLWNSEYKNEDGSSGSSAPFYIDNSRICMKPETSDDSEEEGEEATVEEQHTIKIIRRDPQSIEVMLRQMIGWGNSGDGGYNLACDYQNRRLRTGVCTVNRELLYDPEHGASCLDTLRAWQKIIGGYLSVEYVPVEESGAITWWPYICYKKDSGEEADDVTLSYGINLTEIRTSENGESVVTAIRGTTEQDGKTYTLADSDCPLPVVTDGGEYVRIIEGARKGYLRKNGTWSRYGFIAKDTAYTLSDGDFRDIIDDEKAISSANPMSLQWYERQDVGGGSYIHRRTEDTSVTTSKSYYAKAKYNAITAQDAQGEDPKDRGWYELKAPENDGERYTYVKTDDTSPESDKIYYENAVWIRLYDLVKTDLDTSDSEAYETSVTAIDPRLLGSSDERPVVGNRYPIFATAYGLNGERFVLTKQEMDFVSPGRGKLTLGREKDLLSKQIAIIKKGRL